MQGIGRQFTDNNFQHSQIGKLYSIIIMKELLFIVAQVAFVFGAGKFIVSFWLLIFPSKISIFIMF